MHPHMTNFLTFILLLVMVSLSNPEQESLEKVKTQDHSEFHHYLLRSSCSTSGTVLDSMCLA